jgi:hypothetical protein
MAFEAPPEAVEAEKRCVSAWKIDPSSGEIGVQL